MRRAAPPVPAGKAVVRHRAAEPWTASERAELQHALDDALRPAMSGASAWSCIAIAQNGRTLYSNHAWKPAIAASTQKLIVADAALADLGANFRYDTLLATTRGITGGALDGDLWLAGSGDPSFRYGDLRGGVDALQAAGLRQVLGRVVVDGSAIAGEEINPHWDASDANEDFMAATSGISLDEDTVEFHVTGTRPGEPAAVRIRPQSSAVAYYGSVTTSASDDDVIIAATGTPNVFRLAGDVPPGVGETFYLPVHGIPQYAGKVLDGFLRRAGIAVSGPPLTGTVPLGARVLWTHRSRPLAVLLHHMLVFSDNHFAEQIMRTLGGLDGGAADDADGLQAEKHVLARQKIPRPGLRLLDGSGLAHANRVAAVTLGEILAHEARDGNPLYGLLARDGMDGTLRMYHFHAAKGRVRAKSGHLSDVSSLAGYVDSLRHGRIAFAFLIDGSPADPDAAIVSAVDRIAVR